MCLPMRAGGCLRLNQEAVTISVINAIIWDMGYAVRPGRELRHLYLEASEKVSEGRHVQAEIHRVSRRSASLPGAARKPVELHVKVWSLEEHRGIEKWGGI